MEESAKLKQAREKVTIPVPLPVSYWLFFKRAILERPSVRELFTEAPLDRASFRALVRRKANPAKWGPSFCRKWRSKSEHTVRRMTSDMLAVVWRYYEMLLHPDSSVYVAASERTGGLGLFARRSARLKAGGALFSTHLFGICFGLTEEHFGALEAVSYPSLYRDSILYGPLSLVNHECKAPLRFSLPRKVDADRPRGAQETIALEEFHQLPAVYARSIRDACQVEPDQEITVDYFNVTDGPGKATFFGSTCRCRRCTTK
jgi:hypothetical protein